MNYTTENFKKKLFETSLEKYKEHWHRIGKHEALDIGRWIEVSNLSDQEWIHDLFNYYEDALHAGLGDNYDEEFWEFIDLEIHRYIKNGELEDYIYNQMNDYAADQLYYENPEKYYGYPPKF